jgi:hypothetical protein
MLLGSVSVLTRVASYLTELPPKEVLQKKLKAVADVARGRLEYRKDSAGPH